MAVDVLGDGADLVVGEATEGVLHHLEVVVEVAGAGALDRGQERRVAVGGDHVAGAVERAGLDAPRGLAAEELGGHVRQGLGCEGARDRGLLVALGAVVEQGAGGLDRGGRMGQVVGDDLVVLDRTRGGEVGESPLHHVAGEVDGGRGGVEVGRAHGA